MERPTMTNTDAKDAYPAQSALCAGTSRSSSSRGTAAITRGRTERATRESGVTETPGRRSTAVTSGLLTEQAPRPEHHHDQQHDEDRELCLTVGHLAEKRHERRVLVGERLDEAERQTSDERARQARHAAQDRGREGNSQARAGERTRCDRARRRHRQKDAGDAGEKTG